jgi:hypothetical protein
MLDEADTLIDTGDAANTIHYPKRTVGVSSTYRSPNANQANRYCRRDLAFLRASTESHSNGNQTKDRPRQWSYGQIKEPERQRFL